MWFLRRKPFLKGVLVVLIPCFLVGVMSLPIVLAAESFQPKSSGRHIMVICSVIFDLAIVSGLVFEANAKGWFDD